MRTIQIDVKGHLEGDSRIMECKLIIDDRICRMFISTADYEWLMYDKVFIRDGKEKDSANVINTTNVFVERIPTREDKMVDEITKKF